MLEQESIKVVSELNDSKDLKARIDNTNATIDIYCLFVGILHKIVKDESSQIEQLKLDILITFNDSNFFRNLTQLL